MKTVHTRSVVLVAALLLLGPRSAQASDAAAKAAQVGITAESLVIAGVHQSSSDVLSRIDDASELRLALGTAHAEAEAAAQLATQVAQEALAAPGDSAIAQQLQMAEAAFETQCSIVESLRGQLREVALDGVSSEAVAKLDNWASSEGFRVIPAFRVLERTPEEWKVIEVALRVEARALRRSESPPELIQELLAATRAEPAVQSAETNLTLYLDLTQTIFDQYSGQ